MNLKQKIFFFIFLPFLFIFSGCAEDGFTASGLNLYYVRHAETEANRTHNYSSKNQRTFSDVGKKQIAELPSKLEQYQFDHILVSPKYRTIHTIYPYLKENNLKAEIWPELEECCWQSEKNIPPSRKIPQGKKIKLGDELQQNFILREDASEYEYNAQNYADGVIQLQKACDMIKHKYAGSGKTILVVGHSCAGVKIFEILQGPEARGGIWIDNAKISCLKEEKDGAFKVISLNR